jgi:hypothetical protein
MWLTICGATLRAAETEALPSNDALKARKGEVEAILRSGQIPADKQEVFDSFFNEYLLPQFVRSARLSDMRGVLKEFRGYFTKAVPSAARTRMIELTLAKFNQILFDPTLLPKFSGDAQEKWAKWTAAKYGVLLALSDLNEIEKAGLENAKPLPAALAMLLKVAKPGGKGSTKLTGGAGREDALRIGAVIGLRYHAEQPLTPPESRGQIRADMVAIVNQRQPLEGHEADVNDMLRRRAIDILGVLKEIGPKADVVTALDHVVNDATEIVVLRSEAAKALGGLKYPTNAKLDYKSLANHIGLLVVEASKPILARVKESTLDTDDRRALKTSVHDAADGLNGLAKSAKGSTEGPFVDKVTELTKKLDGALDGSTVTVATVSAAVGALEGALDARREAPKSTTSQPPVKEGEGLAGPK